MTKLSLLAAAGTLAAAAAAWIEPYPYLNGGAMTNPAVPESPDPLVQYAWGEDVNATLLQVYYLAPQSVELFLGSDAASFPGYRSLATPTPNVTVAGPGSLILDFGVESAAWLEIDSPDMPASELGVVSLAVSEYSEVGMYNNGIVLQAKPVPYVSANASGVTTYRLELSAQPTEFYEGARFGFLFVNSTPAQPWHVTGVRLVCQIRPTNYEGSFAVAGDEMLARVWYTAAYTVKVAQQADFMGTILVSRGDRYSWTGDAHVAQAAAMAAFGVYPFVLHNINITAEQSNGIESYSLYWVLSVLDYYHATGDGGVIISFLPVLQAKLEHAWAIWTTPTALGFLGWDDRLGSGFEDPNCLEGAWDYRMIALRAWTQVSEALATLNETTLAAHYAGYAATAINATRALAPAPWYSSLGLFSSSDAINAGFTTAAEQAAIAALHYDDIVPICALAPFNEYFVLQALAAIGQLDKALAVVARCWGGMLFLGATSMWETYQPDYNDFLAPNAAIPGFEDGWTSMCHPWSAGPTPWLTKWVTGVRPTTPGFATFVVAPHFSVNATRVTGAMPLSDRRGAIRVDAVAADTPTASVGFAAAAVASLTVEVPAGVAGELLVSELLAARMLRTPLLDAADAEYLTSSVEYEHACGAEDAMPRTGRLAFSAAAVDGAWIEALGRRSAVAALSLCSGGVNTIKLKLARTAVRGAVLARSAATVAVPAPFPPPVYPAQFVARDTVTQGNWPGVYGSAGYILFSYDVAGVNVAALPPYIASVTQTFGSALGGPWAANTSDPRAPVDPRNQAGPRSIGQYCSNIETNPSFPMDIIMTPAGAGTWYQIALYIVDWDARGRRQTVDTLDGATLSEISPVQLLTDFVSGQWMVYQYNASMRFRFNQIRGDNAVVTAMMFDNVTLVA
jgi:alpha-L-rhamnosidase